MKEWSPVTTFYLSKFKTKTCQVQFNPLPNDKPVQFESVCRRHFKCISSDDWCYCLSRKHCGKRRKCWLPAFSPFSHNVLKRLLFQRR